MTENNNYFYVFNSLKDIKEPLIFKDNKIKWYMCGPTVYNDAHIGHARNYIVNDTIRRILISYGYNIQLVMNITDVDDKIINKSNEMYNNPNDFLKVSQEYEKSFMEDMDNLNILRPDIITRASQYIPEIINFIEEIIGNGYGYQSEGSVYFDSQKYYQDFKDNFNLNLNAESFGQTKLSDKKHPQDFALWKGIKENEPYWDSPWGKGRPGWHIECSSMASDIFGDSFDIHSGGCDLKFPHHENEIKQANARFKKEGWVKYFIHMGHLHIEGLKMSKSLKNFITIKEILKRYNSNQLRVLFLMHKYNQPMDYSEERIEQVNEILKSFTVFITNIETLNEYNLSKYTINDINILTRINELKDLINYNLKDDFNTPEVINNLSEIVKIINKYIKGSYQLSIVKQSANQVKRILTIMGIHFSKRDNNNKKILDVLCKFRDDVRNYAFTNKRFDLLTLTDGVRDVGMPKLNIILEDKSKTTSIWRNNEI